MNFESVHCKRRDTVQLETCDKLALALVCLESTLTTPCILVYKCLPVVTLSRPLVIFSMHYNTIFLLMFTLFAAGAMSASAQCTPIGQACGGLYQPPCCGNGIVHICIPVVFILMLLYHCQVYANRVVFWIIAINEADRTVCHSALTFQVIHIKLTVFHCNSNWTSRRDSMEFGCTAH